MDSRKGILILTGVLSGLLLIATLPVYGQEAKPSACEGKYKGGKKPTQEELPEILREHSKWVSSEEKEGRRAEFCEANLSKANLSKANLRRADLRGATLRGADLRGATLREATLSEADLSRANLSKANLSRADLRGATLRAATVREATLGKATLRAADLRGADLRGANLLLANLFEADLSGATLVFANLFEANLIKTNLIKAKLSGANLSGANLSAATLSGADLSGAILSRATLLRTNLHQATLREVILRRADLRGAYLRKANLQEADLGGADLRGAYLGGADLQKAYLRRASLREANLHEANLQGADVGEANLVEAYLGETDLRGAILSGADLSLSFFEPKIIDAHVLFGAKGLSRIRFDDPTTVVALKQSSLATEERELTSALRKFQLKAEPAYARFLESYLLGGALTDYGARPWRCLVMLGIIIVVFSIPYMFALKRWRRSGIWIILPEDRVHRGRRNPKPIRLSTRLRGRKEGPLTRRLRVLRIGLYFSLLSAFRIGWRELNVGNWITRLQSREYILRATGWVRFVSGFQSLFSTYLLVLWVLIYFARPFE